jgi:hypothetical protein
LEVGSHDAAFRYYHEVGSHNAEDNFRVILGPLGHDRVFLDPFWWSIYAPRTGKVLEGAVVKGLLHFRYL